MLNDDRLILTVLGGLNEAQARLYVAKEAICKGRGGIRRMHQLTGLSRATIARGISELRQLTPADPAEGVQLPADGFEDSDGSNPGTAILAAPRPYRTQRYRIRRPGGGRKLIEKADPTIIPALEQLLADEIAGDPMTEQKWVRSSLRVLSKKLADRGHWASTATVARLLKDMDFSLKANKRKQGRLGCPERDEQFNYIASQKQRFITAGWPVISVDTKKKELIGEFRNNGRTWRRQAEEVHEHDFPGVAKWRAVPFGIYNVAKKEGYVYVGISNDTPEFAVRSIAQWWKEEGRCTYPASSELLILADSGGCNGCRARAWKLNIQEKLCDGMGLKATVCHYPTGCSKWNPVEHRLFSYISMNWQGRPLKTLEIMLAYIRGTSTATGLKVKAFLDRGIYKRGQKVKREDLERINMEPHAVCPKWNYTIHPRNIRP